MKLGRFSVKHLVASAALAAVAITVGSTALFSDGVAQAQGAGDANALAPSLQPGAVLAGYLKFDGVDGEATDEGHKDWIELLSFSQSIQNRGAGVGAGASRQRSAPVIEDIVVTKELDKSSPKLAEACLSGKVFPKVEIHLTKSSGEGSVTYFKYELKNVYITSYQLGGSGDDRPMEQLSLNFEEIKVNYTELDEDGQPEGDVSYQWNVKGNGKVGAVGKW